MISRGDAVRIATGIYNKCEWEMHWKWVVEQGLQGKKQQNTIFILVPQHKTYISILKFDCMKEFWTTV